MDQLKNILILALAVGLLVALSFRGCRDSAYVEPTVKTKYVYDTTPKTVEVPVEKVVTKLTTRWKTDTVRMVEYLPVLRVDTVEIVRTFLEERKIYTNNHTDSALQATITTSVYQNQIESMELKYSILRPIAVTKTYSDRFQLHVAATAGAQTDIAATWRPALGLGLLGEFKTGTGIGIDYMHAIGSAQPHYFGIRATQRIRLKL